MHASFDAGFGFCFNNGTNHTTQFTAIFTKLNLVIFVALPSPDDVLTVTCKGRRSTKHLTRAKDADADDDIDGEYYEQSGNGEGNTSTILGKDHTEREWHQ